MKDSIEFFRGLALAAILGAVLWALVIVGLWW